MQFSFRLSEVLNHLPDPKRRPGTIKAICDYTGLDRHQVSALLKNESKYVPLESLSKICDYLVEHGHCSASDLPGILFAIEPENFWELLARRRRLDLVLGVRVDESWPEGAWVVASDALLSGRLLNGVSTLGGTRKYRQSRADGTEPPLHPEEFRQTLVWAPGQRPDEEVQGRAHDVYQEFDTITGDKAIVGLGSMKANPLIELTVAAAFGATPFKSQDKVKAPTDRSVPFYLRYRDDRKPHPDSCHGGLKLAARDARDFAGIYYEKADGSWACCRWDVDHGESALLFYNYREAQGRLEMVIGGFTGRGTRLIAKTLASQADSFWPPTYQGHGMQLGAFVIDYSLKPREMKHHIPAPASSAGAKVIRVDEEVFVRRFGR